MAKANGNAVARITISEPNFQTIKFRIVGTAPLMIHKFSSPMRSRIKDAQTAKDKVKKAREPKDYEAEFNGARYISGQGWDGMYAGAIRNAMIGAARYVDGLQMTKSKGLFFVKAQGFDKDDGTPLVRIFGKVAHDTRPVRLESGVADLRNRPRYDQWYCDIEVDYDADAVSSTDVANLLHRAGVSVGLCEGRPASSNSFGIGFGTFTVEGSTVKRSAGKSPEVEVPVVRKRGRPRKAPAVPSTEEPLVRRRGRPRKSNGAGVVA